MDVDLTYLKKTPPHSLEAERAVLGGILVNNENLNVLLSSVRPEDFYKDAHRVILEKISAMIDKGLPADVLSLSDSLKRDGQLEEVGGASYLSSLLDGVPRSVNVSYYGQIIREKAMLRRLILSSMKILESSFDEREEADAILDEAQSAIIDVSDLRVKPGFYPVGQLLGPAMQRIEHLSQRQEAVTGVPSGFRDLDGLTAGFHPAEFVVVAARPSMGKTAFCLNIAHHLGTRTDFAVGFFTMEMSKEQLVFRMLCSDAMVDLQKVRKGFVSDMDMQKLRLSAEGLAAARIFLDETAALSLMEMKAKCRRLKLENNLDIAFLDYMQLMRTSGRFENRNQEMSYISRSLKELAKELAIPVVGISQLSRAPEKQRREPRPMLSDLRESGAIEQDSDVVIFIYRPEFYHRDELELQGLAEIIVAKQRNGPTDDIKLVYFNKYTKFADRALGYGEE
ncbi:MAG: replicative DNA helicase [Candidatus Aminicenantes bacterium RBG_13_63_10]|nr:MAG: replicative DNA helicase [Candidatus Aminicenantes bacterium RBG_13_63_10]